MAETKALSDLCSFLDLTPEAVTPFLADGEWLTKTLWDAMLGEHEPDKRYAAADVERYYRHPVVQMAYLLALTEYWQRPERQAALANYVELLSELVPRDGFVLDVGAGTAEILVNLLDVRPDINAWAVDYPGLRSAYVSWRRRSLCEGRYNLHDTAPDAARFIVENSGSWDTVICTSALEHVEDIAATTRELVSWIKPGGYALFEVDWVYNRDFPMHLPVTATWRDKWGTELMPALGMRNIGGALWLKEQA